MLSRMNIQRESCTETGIDLSLKQEKVMEENKCFKVMNSGSLGLNLLLIVGSKSQKVYYGHIPRHAHI